MRLQKLLAAAGLGSRRNIEDWIRAGRITVAGRIAQLGDQAGPGDEVCLDGRAVPLAGVYGGQAELLLYHKPLGELTTRRDPQGRPTVFAQLPLPASGRWISIGRLDVNSSGLLLFTTDGELAHRLMHPSGGIEREYLVRVHGPLPPASLTRLRAGVMLEDGPARFDRIEAAPGEAGAGANSSWRVVLHEGRNREVRRLFAAVGCEVSRLLRVRYGPIALPRELRAGASRPATAQELAALRTALGPAAGARSAPAGR